MISKADLLSALALGAASLFIESTGALPSKHAGYLSKALFATIGRVAFSNFSNFPVEAQTSIICPAISAYYWTRVSFGFSHYYPFEIALNIGISYGLVYAIRHACKPILKDFLKRIGGHLFWDTERQIKG